jgi:hypothetical protein
MIPFFKITLALTGSWILFSLFSCNTPAANKQLNAKNDTLHFRDTIIETDSLIYIGKPCAIIFYLSESDIDSLKTVYGEEDFYTIMDDYNWYVSEAITYLEKRKIPVMGANNRELKFIFAKENGNVYPPTEPGKILLFNGKNGILSTYPIAIQAACDSLFGSFPDR